MFLRPSVRFSEQLGEGLDNTFRRTRCVRPIPQLHTGQEAVDTQVLLRPGTCSLPGKKALGSTPGIQPAALLTCEAEAIHRAWFF